jgi:probable rRNA maturation factor
MINLAEDYYKIWDNETFILEATIVRSFWDDRVIQTFESKLHKASLEVLKSSKAIFLKKKISISLLFAGDKQVTELNKHYRNINKPTNVLSFPSTQINTKSKFFIGDIVFSSQTIIDEARKGNKNLDDHLIHLFIHGVLHLLGYEHETEDDAYIMESLEIKILNKLNIDNPYK